VPYAVGGGSDVAARIFASGFAEALKTSVIIENRGGASGTIGTAFVAHANADGYTLLFGDMGLAVNPALFHSLSYNAESAFLPVAMVARTPLALLVPPSLQVKSFQEFVTKAQTSPKPLMFGSPGIGTPPHLAGIALMKAANIPLTHAPYRGSGPVLNDLIGGHIDLGFSGPAALPQVRSGKLRALAITGDKRQAVMLDIPTFKELGVEMAVMSYGAWWGVVAPHGTPPEVLAKLNKTVNEALAMPTVRSRLEGAGFVVIGGTADEFSAFLKAQHRFWPPVLAAAGVKTR
jgi:tripartite-type tricarboxylate transporter receptor subunit TctC